MNAAEARTLLRWALGNPDTAAEAGTKLWSQLAETLPQVMTTAGAYMFSEWLAKKIGLPAPEKPKLELPALALPEGARAVLVEKISAQDGSDPVENLRERDARSILRARLAKARV